jgi:hypothetical protein
MFDDFMLWLAQSKEHRMRVSSIYSLFYLAPIIIIDQIVKNNPCSCTFPVFDEALVAAQVGKR